MKKLLKGLIFIFLFALLLSLIHSTVETLSKDYNIFSGNKVEAKAVHQYSEKSLFRSPIYFVTVDLNRAHQDDFNGRLHKITTVHLKNNMGYNARLFLGDFNKDAIPDIMVSIDTGGSGGYGIFYIYFFRNNIAYESPFE